MRSSLESATALCRGSHRGHYNKLHVCICVCVFTRPRPPSVALRIVLLLCIFLSPFSFSPYKTLKNSHVRIVKSVPAAVSNAHMWFTQSSFRCPSFQKSHMSYKMFIEEMQAIKFPRIPESCVHDSFPYYELVSKRYMAYDGKIL